MSSFYITRWVCGIAVGSGFVGSFLFFKTDDEKKTEQCDEKKKEQCDEKKKEQCNIELHKWDPNWDKRDVQSLLRPRKRSVEREQQKIEKLTPTATRHILMVRHGQYITETSDDKNMHLTALGFQQAQVLGQRLKELKLDYTKIIRSNLTRAEDTSNIVEKFFPDVPVENTDLLNEGKPIPCEPKAGSFWFEHQYFTDGPRIEAAFRKYFHRAPAEQKTDSFEIMICHANVIRYFVCRLLQVTPEAWLRFSLPHCSITWAVIYPTGNVTIRSLGDVGFLSTNQLTRE